MADLFDRFTGGSGVLSGHTADSGDTWSDPLSVCSIDGSGSVYTSGTFDYSNIPLSSWTPPTNSDHAYAVSMVVGADFASQTSATISIALRVSGAAGSQSYYAAQCYWDSGVQTLGSFRVVSGSVELITGQTPVAVTLSADDVVTAEITGVGATVTITIFKNGTQVYQVIDSDSDRLTATGAVGLRIIPVAGHTDMIRGIWAGDVGGPTGGITPVSPSINLNDSQVFTATGALPNEVINWSATHGAISGSPSVTVTYTAPSLYSSDTITWTSADLPNRGFSDSITLIGTSAIHFDTTSARLTIAPATTLSHVLRYALSTRFKLDTGATDISANHLGVIFSQWGTTASDETILFAYMDSTNPLGFPGGIAPASNCLGLIMGNGAGSYHWYASQIDPFAGFDGLTPGEHALTLDWNLYGDDNAGKAFLTIDGVSLGTDWVRLAPGVMTGGLAATTVPLVFGANSANGWAGLSGIAYANTAIWWEADFTHLPANFRANVFNYSGTNNDPANLAAGYDALVIQTDKQRDVFHFTGASPWTGDLSALTATAESDITTVDGPTLFPPYFTTQSLNPGTDVHTPGVATLTIAWANSQAPGSSVAFTPTVPDIPGAYFSPTTITLTSAGTSTGSADLIIPPGQSLGSYEIDISNDGNILPASVIFNLVAAPVFIVAGNAKMQAGGNIINLTVTDVDGTAYPVTGLHMAGVTVSINGGSPKALDDALAVFNGVGSGGDPIVSIYAGQACVALTIDDTDEACVHGGAGATWHSTSTQSLGGQAYGGSLSYSPDATATSTRTYTGVRDGYYFPECSTPDTYANGAQTVGGTATTQARYVVTDGTHTYTFDINQQLEAAPTSRALNSSTGLSSRFSDLNSANATATITDGVVTAITPISGGSNYGGTPPTVVIQSGTGSGAVVTCTVSGGSITGYTIVSGGSGYEDRPLVVIHRPSFLLTGGTVTITLTNQAGSGTLYDDAVRLELDHESFPLMKPGDTGVLHLPDSSVSTHAGSIAETTIDLTLQSWSDMMPYDSTLPRNPGFAGRDFGFVGYNAAGMAPNQPGHMLADRCKVLGGWLPSEGSVSYSVDGRGELTSVTGTGSIQLGFSAQWPSNGDDYWGAPTEPLDPTWKVIFKAETGGNPVVGVEAANFLTTIGGAPWSGGDNGGNPVTIQQSALPANVPVHNVDSRLILNSSGATNNAIKNLKIFDGWTDPSWDKTIHPKTYEELSGFDKPGFIRFLNFMGPGSNAVNFDDQHDSTDPFYGLPAKTSIFSIASIEPFTGNSAATTLAEALFPAQHGLAVVVVALDPDGPAHDFVEGQQVFFNNFSSFGPFPDTSGSTGISLNNQPGFFQWVGVIDDHTLICTVSSGYQGYGGGATATTTLSGDAVATVDLGAAGQGYFAVPTVTISGGGGTGASATAVTSGGVVTGFTDIVGGSGYTAPPTVTIGTTPGASSPITLASSVTLVTGEEIRSQKCANTAPFQDCISICNDVSWHCFFNVPMIASDDFCLQAGKYAAANAWAGMIPLLQVYNEIWNYSFGALYEQQVHTGSVVHLYSTTSGAQGANLQSQDAWQVYRGGQMQAQFLAGWTGIPEVRITGYGHGATAVATLVGGEVTAITLTGPLPVTITPDSGGSGYTSPPAVMLIGGLGPGGIPATATAVLTGDAVTSITTTGGWGYSSAPAISFSGGGGTGAAATATVGTGGTGYTSAPTVEILGGYGSGATATASVAGGLITGIAVTAPGSGYTLTGRDHAHFIRWFGAFAAGSDIAQRLAEACIYLGVPMDAIGGDTYQSSIPPHGSYLSVGGSVGDFFDACGQKDQLGMLALATFNCDHGFSTSGQISAVRTGGVLYDVANISYEGGVDYPCPAGTDIPSRAHLPLRDINSTQYELARNQQLHYKYGMNSCVYFTLNDSIAQAGNAEWFTYASAMNGIGTGDATTENVRPYLVPWITSPVGRAHKLFAASQSPTPTPTATHLAVIVQPSSSITAGSPFSLTFAAEDGVGSIDITYNSNISIAIDHNPSHGILSGTLTVAATSGIATFTGLSINKAGSGYTIKATATGLTSIDTIGFAIVGGPATKLLFTTEPPGTAYVNGLFSVDISGVDAFGNTDPTYTASVTIALDANPGPAILGGTLTHSAVSGRARFTGLSLDVIASGYTIAASNGVLTDATSNSVVVIAAPPPGTNFGFWFFGN